MAKQFEPHEIIWTKEKVSRMWDYFSSSKAYLNISFSQVLGDSVINFVRQHKIPFEGRILDYGCGTGALLEKLLARGISCEGAEFSSNYIEIVNSRFKDNPLFNGIELLNGLPTPYKDNTFGMIFLNDVIEHLLPDELENTIQEIYRILKPGGFFIITTPNQEPLDPNKVMCPECGCIFHRGQHIRIWEAATLQPFMESCHYQTIICQSTTFRPKSKLTFLRAFYGKLRQEKDTNLIYIGRK